MRSIVRAICISWIFYIRDLRLGQFRDLPMKSMGKISTTSFMHRNISIHWEWCWLRSSVMTQATVFHRWPSKGHLRSPKVTNSFLQITFDPNAIETWEWSHCVSLIKTHRYICNMTYLGHQVTLTWGQIFDLNLSRSCYTCFDASWQGKHDGVKSIALSFQTRKVSSKNCFAQKCRFSPFRDLTPKPLILGEIWRHFTERAFQELSIAFLNFDVAVTGTEIMRIIWSHVM